MSAGPAFRCLPFFAAVMLAAMSAHAAPKRVAVLSKDGASIGKRLERNLHSMHFDAVLTASITLCSRDVVTRLMDEMKVESALCADGDAIGVWTRQNDQLVLKDVIVIQGTEERTEEVDAARAALALRGTDKSSSSARGYTIVVSPGTAAPGGSPLETVAAPAKDKPPLASAPPTQRNAPRAVFGLGPQLLASKDGSSFGINGEIEIGVSRYVALVPWISYVPSSRTAERPEGTASFRPTLFGFGFNVPLLPNTSAFVPRLGCGYAILWMHVTPETARPPAVTRGDSEDLLAPVMYVNAAASIAIASGFRVVGEGLFGTSSHEMVVRINGSAAARWGVPIAGLALRGEWVLP
jgi:hypothetical protein